MSPMELYATISTYNSRPVMQMMSTLLTAYKWTSTAFMKVTIITIKTIQLQWDIAS